MKTPTQKFFKPTLVAASVAAILVGLTGCLGSGDGDKPSTNNLQMSGAVVDGFVANGRIWVDMNGNNQRDNNEPWAYTDAQGHFSERPAKGTEGQAGYQPAINYCADPRVTARYKHCLEVPSDAKERGYKICSAGGRDQLTGKQYGGIMCLSLANANQGLYVNPLSSMSASLTDDGLKKLYKYFTGNDLADNNVQTFRERLVTLNTFDKDSANTLQSDALLSANDYLKIFKFAFQAHKIAEALSTYLSKAYQESTEASYWEQLGMNLNESAFVPMAFQAIAEYLSGDFGDDSAAAGYIAFPDSPFTWDQTSDPFNPKTEGDKLAHTVAIAFVNNVVQYTHRAYNDVTGNDYDYEQDPNHVKRVAELLTTQGSQAIANAEQLILALNNSLDVANSSGIEKKGFIAEIATEATKAVQITVNTSNGGSVTTDAVPTNLVSNSTALLGNDNLDPKKVDFEYVKEKVKENVDIQNSGITLPNPDNDLTILSDSTDGSVQYIGAANDNDKIYVFFKDFEANDDLAKGNVEFCVIDGNEATPVAGTYEVDADKTNMLFINTLGQDILIKNLDPTLTYGGDSTGECSGKNSCLSVTYLDPTDFEYATKFFGGTIGFADIVGTVPATITVDGTLCSKLANNTVSLPTTLDAEDVAQ